MKTKDTLRVLIADDHALVRMGFRMLLEASGRFTVVGEAADGREAVAKQDALKPDVIVMDLSMPVMDGATATAAIRAANATVGILLLTTFADPEIIRTALDAGATGALLKSSANTELLDALGAAARGERYLSDDIRELLSANLPAPGFSDRQRQVLDSLIRGLTNREIALQLGISPDRIKQHLNAIYEKLGAANRAEAVAIALRHQLLKA